jgi:hypothetical protein
MAFGTVMLLFVLGALIASQITSDREILIVIGIFGGLLLALYRMFHLSPLSNLLLWLELRCFLTKMCSQ